MGAVHLFLVWMRKPSNAGMVAPDCRFPGQWMEFADRGSDVLDTRCR